MKPQEIQEGNTYVNNGAGKTSRTVLLIYKDTNCIGDDISTVRYQQHGGHWSEGIYHLSLTSFASWAKKEVE